MYFIHRMDKFYTILYLILCFKDTNIDTISDIMDGFSGSEVADVCVKAAEIARQVGHDQVQYAH